MTKLTLGILSECLSGPRTMSQGPFNNYVDKMRGGGQKMSVFVHAQGIKTVHAGGGGQKIKGKILST